MKNINLTRRNFLRNTLATAAATAWIKKRAFGNAGRQPNLLFVLADQWRFCSFSHGDNHDKLVQTPNLDKFAQEGAHWKRSYATNPLCTPERSVIMTGRYPHQTGMIANDLMIPPGNHCMAEVFCEAGYATHYIGKTHFDGSAKPGFIPKGWRRRGFTTYEGFNRGHNYMSGQEYFDNDGNLIKPNEYEPSYQTDLAIDFIEQHRNRPWFCYLSWGPPHTPYEQVPSIFKHYNVTESDRRPNVPSGNPGSIDLQNYFAQCEALDFQFGRLMEALHDLGQDRNTLIVFTADHGDMHKSQGKDHKGHAEEESLHIPLFMRWPGTIAAGQTPDTLFGGVDMMPTLLSLCGHPVPDTCSGIDKSAAVLDGGSPPTADAVYCGGQMNKSDAWRCIVTDDGYKLALNISLDVAHMYDLNTDPYETDNLNNSTDPNVSTKRDELRTQLLAWRDATGDSFPTQPEAADDMYNT